MPILEGRTQNHSRPAIVQAPVILPEGRPLGLIGDVIADHWEFASGRRHRLLKMAWTRKMANGFPLNHEVNSGFWELARRYFTACRNGYATGEPLAVKTCIGNTYALFLIIDHVMQSGHSSLWSYPKRESESLLAALAGGTGVASPSRNVRATISHRLEISRKLYILFTQAPAEGSVLNDGFRFAPLSGSQEVVALARLIGQEQGTTPDAPPEVVFKCLGAAIEYVAYYADEVIELSHAARQLREQVECESAAVTKKPRYSKNSEIATALLTALDVRPAWVDALGTIMKSDLARQLGMRPSDIYKLRYKPLIESAELQLRGINVSGTKEAQQILVQAAKAPKPRDEHPGREVGKRLGLPFTGAAGQFSPWPISIVGNSKGDRIGLGTVVTQLWTASYLILGAFMCDRESETLATEADCLVQGVDGWYIRTPNFKTRNGEGGSLVLQPCPAVVVLAVQVLQRLSAFARSQANSEKLFCIEHHMGVSVPEETELRKRVLRFAEVAGADTYGAGEHWHLTPQQLRRFFPTAWVNYYEYGRNFKALSDMLDHASIGTTIRYASGIVQGSAVSRQQKNLTNRILNDVALGSIFAKGPAAHNWSRFAERLRVKAIPEDQFSDWVDERSDRNDYNVFAMPWGYCLWSKVAGLYAQCLEKSDRSVGISRPQNRKSCGVCGNGGRNFLTTEVFSPFWEHSVERHQRLAANPAAPVRYREASKLGIRIAQSFGATAMEAGSAP